MRRWEGRWVLKADGDSCASAKSDSAVVVASAGRTGGLWGAIFCSGEGAGVLWLGRERDGAPKACKTKMQRAASVGGGCGHGCAALESVDGRQRRAEQRRSGKWELRNWNWGLASGRCSALSGFLARVGAHRIPAVETVLRQHSRCSPRRDLTHSPPSSLEVPTTPTPSPPSARADRHIRSAPCDHGVRPFFARPKPILPVGRSRRYGMPPGARRC
jgi:hypothetical protein